MGQTEFTPATPPQAPYLSFTDAIRMCFNKYADFSGRATRAEFWWFYLFNFVAGWVLNLLLIGDSTFLDLLAYVASVALWIPGLAVTWRRLHDIGKAGGWIFIGLIPIVGWIILIVWYATRGEEGPNRFGPQPNY